MQEILMDFYIFLRTVIVLLFLSSFCHFYKKSQQPFCLQNGCCFIPI